MSVIAEIRIAPGEFELGRIVDLDGEETAELESVVPTGESRVHFCRVYDADFEKFRRKVGDHPAVDRIAELDRYDDCGLFTFEWASESDAMFRGVERVDGSILGAAATAESWWFELRFPSHDAMSAFRSHCEGNDVEFEVLRVSTPSEPEMGLWFGLTERQREAIVLAVERGYYDIPRDCTTVELAEELDISDQAVTERLRRAIATLVSNTVMTAPKK